MAGKFDVRSARVSLDLIFKPTFALEKGFVLFYPSIHEKDIYTSCTGKSPPLPKWSLSPLEHTPPLVGH